MTNEVKPYAHCVKKEYIRATLTHNNEYYEVMSLLNTINTITLFNYTGLLKDITKEYEKDEIFFAIDGLFSNTNATLRTNNIVCGKISQLNNLAGRCDNVIYDSIVKTKRILEETKNRNITQHIVYNVHSIASIKKELTNCKIIASVCNSEYQIGISASDIIKNNNNIDAICVNFNNTDNTIECIRYIVLHTNIRDVYVKGVNIGQLKYLKKLLAEFKIHLILDESYCKMYTQTYTKIKDITTLLRGGITYMTYICDLNNIIHNIKHNDSIHFNVNCGSCTVDQHNSNKIIPTKNFNHINICQGDYVALGTTSSLISIADSHIWTI